MNKKHLVIGVSLAMFGLWIAHLTRLPEGDAPDTTASRPDPLEETRTLRGEAVGRQGVANLQ